MPPNSESRFYRWLSEESDREHAEALEAAEAERSPERFFERRTHPTGASRWVFIGRDLGPSLARDALSGGMSAEEVSDAFGLTVEQVQAAATFVER